MFRAYFRQIKRICWNTTFINFLLLKITIMWIKVGTCMYFLYRHLYDLLIAITPHHGISYPTCKYSNRYCTRPEGHQLARPRASSGGSPIHWMAESEVSGSGIGFSGKKSRMSSSCVPPGVVAVASPTTETNKREKYYGQNMSIRFLLKKEDKWVKTKMSI